jgi:hypothetical protein
MSGHGQYDDGCPRHEEERPRCPCPAREAIAFGALVLLVLLALLVVFTLGSKAPRYSAAIDSVTGLDLDDLDDAPLNPLFNLTLRATSRGFMGGGCVEAGSAVEVSYAGVTLATGPVLQRFCSPSRGHKAEQAVVAWGTGVQVPGFALDGLADDAWRGTPMFDVVVRMPSNHANNHEGKLVSCWGLRVGDAATLGAPCAVADVDTVPSSPNDRHGRAT